MGRTNTAIRIVPQDNEAKVREYRRLDAEIKNLEDMKKALNADLTAQAEANGGTITVGKYCVKVSACKRESLNVKNAVQALGRQILAPFISVSEYTQLRINVIDEDEEYHPSNG